MCSLEYIQDKHWLIGSFTVFFLKWLNFVYKNTYNVAFKIQKMERLNRLEKCMELVTMRASQYWGRINTKSSWSDVARQFDNFLNANLDFLSNIKLISWVISGSEKQFVTFNLSRLSHLSWYLYICTFTWFGINVSWKNR